MRLYSDLNHKSQNKNLGYCTIFRHTIYVFLILILQNRKAFGGRDLVNFLILRLLNYDKSSDNVGSGKRITFTN
jgi:hypothetical protein